MLDRTVASPRGSLWGILVGLEGGVKPLRINRKSELGESGVSDFFHLLAIFSLDKGKSSDIIILNVYT